MRKAQLGVEFFLVLSVVVAFIVILYATAFQEIGKTRTLNDAVISKAAVDAFSQGIDFVYLGGNGSVLQKDVFVSPNSNCFYQTPVDALKIYCTVSSEYLDVLTGGREQVFSQELLIPRSKLLLYDCAPFTGGWVNVSIRNLVASRGVVNVSCKTA